MAERPADPPLAGTYAPLINTSPGSPFIVINDNCIMTLEAALSVSSIGKILSTRGHELYSLYSADGKVLCQFEGTGLMQRTLQQLEEISGRSASRIPERERRSERMDRLERMVDVVWYTPGMPGAAQAAEDFEQRRSTLARGTEETDQDGLEAQGGDQANG